jgi:hypothetical protein
LVASTPPISMPYWSIWKCKNGLWRSARIDEQSQRLKPGD